MLVEAQPLGRGTILYFSGMGKLRSNRREYPYVGFRQNFSPICSRRPNLLWRSYYCVLGKVGDEIVTGTGTSYDTDVGALTSFAYFRGHKHDVSRDSHDHNELRRLEEIFRPGNEV